MYKNHSKNQLFKVIRQQIVSVYGKNKKSETKSQ